MAILGSWDCRLLALLAALVGAVLIGPGLTWAQQAPGRQPLAGAAATAEQLAALERVLARPEFQVADGRSPLDSPRRLLRAAWLTLARWLTGWVGGPEAQSARRLGFSVAVALVLLGLIVVARLARGSLAAEARQADVSSSGPPRAEAELARAERLAAAGDFRGAAHHRYLAVLRRLDERNLLRFDQALTNRELLPRAAAQPVVQAALVPLVEQFDRLWYGQSTCQAAEYAAFAELTDRAWRVTE